jgi:type I restriction enzyme S subunit
MTFNGPIGGLIDFAIGGGWGSEVPKENHSRVAVIRGTDIPKVASGEFSTVPFRYESDKKILNRILAPGDVVLETAGGSSANGQYTGRTLLITQEILDVLGPTICASFCKKLVLNKDLVSPSYFYLYMQDLYKSGRVASYDSQSTGISNFQYEAFVNNELLELPNLEIQTSVATALSNLQSKINNNSQISKTLEDIAQSIFKSWFIDFDPVKAKMVGEQPEGMDAATAALFPDSMGESELGLIPKGWKVSNLDSLSFVRYGAPFASKLFNTTKVGLPLIRIRDLKKQSISTWSPEKHAKGFLVSGGELLVGMDGEFNPTIWFGEDALVNQRICKIEPKDFVSNFFLYFTLLPIMRKIEHGSTGSTVIHLGKTDIDAIKVAEPPQKILAEYKSMVEPMLRQMVSLNIQTRILEQARDALLPRLISGELQIPEEMLVS